MAKKQNNVIRRRAQINSYEDNFVRNMTMSGFDQSNNNTTKTPPRKEPNKKNNTEHKAFKIIAFIAAIAGFVLLAVSQFVVSVSDVDYIQSGISAEKNDGYIAFANQYLLDNPPERILWFLQGDKFLATAKANFPEISEITIKSSIFNGSHLAISLREPVAMLAFGNLRHYIDKNGASFEKNYFYEPNIIINDQNSFNQGSNISSRMLEFIGKTIAGIKESGIGEVQEVNIPVSAARYIELKLADRGFFVKVQIDRDIDSQITDIVNMVKFLDDHDIKPNYIDVRVKNRGYYK
jgi:hypothetical protein